MNREQRLGLLTGSFDNSVGRSNIAPFGMPVRIGPRDRKQQLINQIRWQMSNDSGRADERIRARTRAIVREG